MPPVQRLFLMRFAHHARKTMRRGRRRLVLLCLSVLNACAGATSSPTSADRPSLVQNVGSALPLVALGTQEFSWSSGQPPTWMGPTYQYGRACVLVHVAGRFSWRSDSIVIYRSDQSPSGVFYLTGSVPQGHAKARCYSNVYVEPGYTATVPDHQGSLSVQRPMFDLPFACGLTGLRGNFALARDSVSISLEGSPRDGYNWALNVQADPSNINPDLKASADCFATAYLYTPTPFTWRETWPANTPPTKLWSTFRGKSCFLSGMHGRFRGSEFVAVYTSGTNWWLNGNSAKATTGGEALCIQDTPWVIGSQSK